VNDSPWLSVSEQTVWRSWLNLNAQLSAVLHRQLAEESGLTLSDFEVLVQLTDSVDGKVRVTDLSRALNWDRSRVSHHVTRMQSRGLVQREECADDRRGAFVAITSKGREALTFAAPGHARTVKDLVFADLTRAELEIVGSFIENVLSRLSGYVSDRQPRGADARTPH
jgi:DNA-binding MarR family transcriptional regulator